MCDNVAYNSEDLTLIGRIYYSAKKHKIDVLISVGLFAFLFILAYIVLGFAANGINTPYVYSVGDETGYYFTLKQINDTGWNWDYSRVGAPFDYKYNFSFAGNYTMNADLFVILIISLFTDNIAVILNIFLVIIFPLSGLCSYITCRNLKLNYLFSVLCSIVFALSPYEFWRIGGHMNLVMCCFVPFSILLCVWAVSSKNDDFLAFKKGFFKKGKNIATIVLCILIANNGIGYYSIFTCYFLLITTIYILLKRENKHLALVPVKMIAFIGTAFVIEIIPSIVDSILSKTELTERAMVESELYGLKIAQLFIPMNSHGIDIIQKIIDTYNNNMVCINENVSSYLGIAGIIGFLLTLVISICADKINEERQDTLRLLSNLNIFAILLGTIGGFSALISFVFHFLRGYNRISIFILFISLLSLFIFIQNAVDRKNSTAHGSRFKAAAITLSCCLCLISVFDQLPTFGARDEQMQMYSQTYYSDHDFFENMEQDLGENASVFQLPYQVFEGPPINQMSAYEHFKGFVHSDTLKWSFGAAPNSIEDMWWKRVSSMPAEDMINTICEAGMKAIYINAKAYTEAELVQLEQSIESVIQQPPVVSSDGVNIYYSLNKFITDNNIKNDDSVLKLTGNTIPAASLACTDNSERGLNQIVLHKDGTQYGPYCSLKKGNYIISVHGQNLSQSEYDISYNIGNNNVQPTEISVQDDVIQYKISLSDDIDGIEFRTFNHTDTDVKVYYIVIQKEDS